MAHLQPFHAVLFSASATPPVRCSPHFSPEIFSKLVVEIDRVGLQLGDVRVAVQRVKPTGGMPCRAAGKLVALKQNDIFPAGLGEVVEDGTANDAAADDDRLCVGFHERLSSECRE